MSRILEGGVLWVFSILGSDVAWGEWIVGTCVDIE